MKKEIKVNSIVDFEFWLGCFRPRRQKWQRAKLKELQTTQNPLTNAKDTPDKIKALEFLLSK